VREIITRAITTNNQIIHYIKKP